MIEHTCKYEFANNVLRFALSCPLFPSDVVYRDRITLAVAEEEEEEENEKRTIANSQYINVIFFLLFSSASSARGYAMRILSIRYV